jgi:hypothetical protein
LDGGGEVGGAEAGGGEVAEGGGGKEAGPGLEGFVEVHGDVVGFFEEVDEIDGVVFFAQVLGLEIHGDVVFDGGVEEEASLAKVCGIEGVDGIGYFALDHDAVGE